MRITYFEILGDIKTDYTKLRQDGQSRNEAVQILMAQYHDELTTGAEDDGLLFWVGLADAQYALKELSVEVSVQGLAALERLKVAIPEITPGDIEKRQERYACAPMPERTHVRSPKRYRCQWRIGDTFAYQMSGPEAEKNGVAGEYVLLRKVDELEWDNQLHPVVTLTHWKKTALPLDAAEFQSAPILRLKRGKMCANESSYEYRVEVLFSRPKQLQDLKLQYLGNFANIAMPTDEYYDGRPGYVLMIHPKRFNSYMNYYCSLQSYYEAQ